MSEKRQGGQEQVITRPEVVGGREKEKVVTPTQKLCHAHTNEY